jgi:mannose-6-phosphate isomerase-like protein (cupin superfamily)
MEARDASLIKGSYDKPDETRTLPNATVDVVHLGSGSSARLTMQPGWRWSESVKPVVGTEQCEVRHVGLVLAGHMTVAHGDQTMDLGPGDAYVIEPGHDAWVQGDETLVGYEFESKAAETYGTKA